MNIIVRSVAVKLHLSSFSKTAVLHAGLVISKGTVSVFLTKYHAIKTYPVLNYAPRHEDACGSGGIVLRILNLGTRWR